MEYSSWINFIIFLVFITGAQCLRNVSLKAIPGVVERGSSVTLQCHYILDGMKLYAVKWYRGKHEFYRYSPSDESSIKVFDIPGINVDRTQSNQTQVTITNVDYVLSGNFCCEVTTDAPTFLTESGVMKLLVVSLPKSRPNITTERSRYESGDILNANCSVPSSRPPVEFIFKLNNVEIGPINATQLESNTKISNLISSNIGNREDSRLQYATISTRISPVHFSNNNQLILRCIARISDGIYRDASYVNLSDPMGDPKSEKVTSGSNRAIIFNIGYLTTISAALLSNPFLR